MKLNKSYFFLHLLFFVTNSVLIPAEEKDEAIVQYKDARKLLRALKKNETLYVKKYNDKEIHVSFDKLSKEYDMVTKNFSPYEWIEEKNPQQAEKIFKEIENEFLLLNK